MPIQTINLGTYANDGTGDDLRTAFTKVNENFAELDLQVASNGVSLGSGTAIFAGKVADSGIGSLLSFRSVSAGTNLQLTNSSNNLVFSTLSTLTASLTGNVTGNLTGNVTGNVSGNLTGNVTGQVSDITNHDLAQLSDVAATVPSADQVLTYQSGLWRPVTPTSHLIVSDEGGLLTDNAVSLNFTGSAITATAAGGAITINAPLPTTTTVSEGTNLYYTDARARAAISVSGSGSYNSSTGVITIVSGGGSGGNLDFGTITSPEGFTLDLGSI